MESMTKIIRFIEKRNNVFTALEQLAKTRGFLRVESDYFEDMIPYVTKNTRQNPDQLVKVQDQTGRVQLLRPDITTNLIKQVIPNLQAGEELDLYYLESIFSFGENGQIERTRQFGVEVIGKSNLEVDLNLIQLVDAMFERFDLSIIIEIGNQRWIERLIANLQLTTSQERVLKEAIIAKDSVAIDQSLPGSPYKDLLLDVLATEGDLKRYVATIERDNLDCELLVELNRMQTMKQQIGNGHILFDLSLINPFDYYNGPIFKGYIDGYETDIVRGGRYDTLTEEYGQLTPALGFSLDVDRLVDEVVRRG